MQKSHEKTQKCFESFISDVCFKLYNEPINFKSIDKVCDGTIFWEPHNPLQSNKSTLDHGL